MSDPYSQYSNGSSNPYPSSTGNPYDQPSNNPYGTTPYSMQPTNPYVPYNTGAPKSPALGIIGFVIVVLGAVAGLVMIYLSGELTSQLHQTYGENMPDPSNLPGPDRQALAASGLWALGALGASLIGFVGWVISIVATAINRGRLWGILGIVLGVVAPIVMATVWIWLITAPLL